MGRLIGSEGLILQLQLPRKSYDLETPCRNSNLRIRSIDTFTLEERRTVILTVRRHVFAPLVCLLLYGVLIWLVPIKLIAQVIPEPPGSTEPTRLTAPRIQPLPEEQWTDAHKALVARYGPEVRVGNAFKTLLNVPELLEAVMPFILYITTSDSTLSPRHRELLILRTAWLCQNVYVWADHVPVARIAGVTTEEVHRIAQGPAANGWDPFESTLLSLADELFRNSAVRDTTWSALEARYDLYHMVDAVMTVNEVTLLSMLFNSIGIQPDDSARARFPTGIPYRLTVPDREPPLTAPRVDPIEGPGIRVRRTFARHPRVAETRRGNSNYVNRISPLTPHYRELLILRIGWNCQAVYEWAKHVGSVGRARDHGLEPEWIAAGPDAPGWNAFEMAHLHAADEIYRDGIVSDTTWNALAERYNTREMMSVVMTVANYRLVSMSLNAFGVQPLDTDELFPVIPLH